MAQAARTSRVPLPDKFAVRRDELALAALNTLAKQGYAKTSLRDIAEGADFSHGVLHYYFRDKIELITYCVRLYKTACMTGYDEVVATATTADGLRDGIATAMAETLHNDGHMHRLWYDMRSQSLFEPLLRDDVLALDRGLEAMIWRIVTRFSDLAGRPLAVGRTVAYGLFDGVFQQALLRLHAGDPEALRDLKANVVCAFDRLLLD